MGVVTNYLDKGRDLGESTVPAVLLTTTTRQAAVISYLTTLSSQRNYDGYSVVPWLDQCNPTDSAGISESDKVVERWPCSPRGSLDPRLFSTTVLESHILLETSIGNGLIPVLLL